MRSMVQSVTVCFTVSRKEIASSTESLFALRFTKQWGQWRLHASVAAKIISVGFLLPSPTSELSEVTAVKPLNLASIFFSVIKPPSVVTLPSLEMVIIPSFSSYSTLRLCTAPSKFEIGHSSTLLSFFFKTILLLILSNVASTESMFQNCTELKSIKIFKN